MQPCTHKQQELKRLRDKLLNSTNQDERSVLESQSSYMNMSPCADCSNNYQVK